MRPGCGRRPMLFSLITDPRHWRARAEEARLVAAKMTELALLRDWIHHHGFGCPRTRRLPAAHEMVWD
jgi:hypothetical protein